MKYQVLKALRTKTKLVKVCDSLEEAHEVLKQEGAIFHSFSYIGGFPLYEKMVNGIRKYIYEIQGLHEKLNVLVSIPKQELSAFNFRQ